MLQKIPLATLVGQVIELSICYHPIGHGKVVGRVRLITGGAARDCLWVGDFNFPTDAEVRLDVRGGKRLT